MYRHCATEDAASRQRQIEICLLENMTRMPFEQISVAGLCKELKISRGIFYHYFDDKHSCLTALIDHTLMDFAQYEPVIEKGLEQYPREILNFLMFWQQHSDLLEALNANHFSSLLLDRAVDHIFREEWDTLRWYGADQGEYSEETILFAMSGVVALLMKWHTSGYQKTIAQMAEAWVRLMTKPLASPPSGM